MIMPLAFIRSQNSKILYGSGNPVREHGKGNIFLVCVVVGNMNSKVMFPTHFAMHHKLH